jgi:subtilisin-like proprotein convertase family protein
MKNLLRIFVLSTALLLVNCSKDDEDSNKLELPATIENNTALAITDATEGAGGSCGSGTIPGSSENMLMIDKNGTIKDASKVSIVLNLSHSYGGDLVVQLFDPSGESCTLIKRIGSTDLDTSCGKGCDFVSGNLLIFNSATETMLDPALAAIPSGNYAPTSGLSTFPTDAEMVALETFLTDKKINGTWKIKIRDCGIADLGTLVSWKLVFDTGALK